MTRVRQQCPNKPKAGEQNAIDFRNASSFEHPRRLRLLTLRATSMGEAHGSDLH